MARNKRGLPTGAEYRSALDRGQAAYDAYEAIKWHLEEYTQATNKDRVTPPSLEEIGAAYSFVEGLRLEAWQTSAVAEEIKRKLGELDLARLNAPVRGAARARAGKAASDA